MIYGGLLVLAVYLVMLVYRKADENKHIAYESQIQRQIIEQQKEAIQSIRKKQHEYKNTIGNLNALLLGQDVESARSYVKEILDENACVDQMIRENGNFVGLLLEYKMQEARKRQIRTEQDVVLCQEMPISEYDIAVVINNAMNNAMEACEKLPEVERYIRCVVNMKMRYLNFYFENPCADGVCERAGRLVTSKADKSVHGLGMENIKDVARKYDGFTSYGVENGVFWLRCSLSMCRRESA